MGLHTRVAVLAAVVISLVVPLALDQRSAAASMPLVVSAGHTSGAVLTSSLPVAAAPSCPAGLVALTFDDGPARGLTVRLVQMLERLHVPATFFMVGSRVRTAPYAAHVVAHARFPVGNHTWSHPHLTRLSDSAIRSEIRRTATILHRTGVPATPLMRPPYGAIDRRVRADVHGLRLVPVLWDVDSNDWRGGSSAVIAGAILRHLHPHGSNIVLQHDGVRNSPASVAAVPRVVRVARQRGYCFTTLGPDGRMAPIPVPVESGSEPSGARTSLQAPATFEVSAAQGADPSGGA